MLDKRITGGSVVSGRGTARLDIGISGGAVAGVYRSGEAPEASETIDASGLLVFPGFVDAHFHCRAPGHPEREDFESGTQAAAAGGITTICEMPIALPGVHTGAILEDRRALAEQTTHVDFALWGGGGAGSAEDIRDMAAAGAIGYKIFLHSAPAGREREFEGLTAVDTPSLHRALEWIAPTGLPAAVHCEDDALIHAFTAGLKERGDVGPTAHERSRPGFVELLAVSNVLLLAEALHTRVHFPHISTARAVQLCNEARAKGQPVSVETCPHYLLFEHSVIERLGPFAKINPPIRPASDRDALWESLLDGRIDIVASDHAPYTPEEKELGWTDIFAAPSGSPSVETMVPAMLSRALDGAIPLERVVTLLAERPAELFGLAPRKGRLEPGSDADVVLFDPAGSWTVHGADLLTRSRGSARLFEGQTLRGRVRATYVRGALVYDGQRIVNQPGSGQFVRPG